MEQRIAFYDTHSYDKESFMTENVKFGFKIDYFDFKLGEKTAYSAEGYDAVCVFVNDILNEHVIDILSECKVQAIILRCAGFNNVNLDAAKRKGIAVFRVPSYSPHAVAEHAMAMILAITRKIPQAYLRTKTANFTLEGLTGRELNGLKAGVLGTGKIGKVMAEIFNGFGMKVILSDQKPDMKWASEHGFEYYSLEELFKCSDVLSLHAPLTDDTYHIINEKSLKLMKKTSIIVNTGRGALIDSKALVHALKHKEIGGAALDVYEEESMFFFKDCSTEVMTDDILARLLTFPNVLVTGHQAFLTTNALANIAETSLSNAMKFFKGQILENKIA